MNPELISRFRKTNWCRIIDTSKNSDEFEELFELKNKLKFSKVSSIEYTFDVINAIDCVDEDEKRSAIELLVEYIDRGIHDWDEFSGKLASDYPLLKFLSMSQNYSSYDRNRILRVDGESAELYNNKIDDIITDKFLLFLSERKLLVFCLDDFQSSFLRKIDPAKILNVQPHHSLYSIVINQHNMLPKGTVYIEDKRTNKQLFFHVRNNEDQDF